MEVLCALDMALSMTYYYRHPQPTHRHTLKIIIEFAFGGEWVRRKGTKRAGFSSQAHPLAQLGSVDPRRSQEEAVVVLGLESDSAQRSQALEHHPVLFYTAGQSALSCVTVTFPYLVKGIEQNPPYYFIKDE